MTHSFPTRRSSDLAARSANAGNHTRMVERVGENHAAGENFRERGKRRFVRYITRGKKEPPFLAMEVGKLGFEIDMIVRVAADIARTARPCPHIVQRRDRKSVVEGKGVSVRLNSGGRRDIK